MPGRDTVRAMRQPGSRRQGFSLAIALVSGALMLSMGAARYLNDGSLWIDEAAIAYNLVSMPALELFGPLDTGHQFPRLYLAAIHGLRLIFGYETAVLRALPFGFFVLGVLLWQRLLWLRFRERPLWMALGALLCMVPGIWFAYSAMFKQYSLDVCVALLPFLLDDDTLRRRWRQREDTWRLVPWLLPCLFSLTYGVAWLGRLAGHWLGGAREHGATVPLRSTLVLLGSFAAAMAAAWWIDLRHAIHSDATANYWSAVGCVSTGEPTRALPLMAAWVLGWTGGSLPLSGQVAVPTWARAALFGTAVLGASAALVGAWRGPVQRAPAARRDAPIVDDADRARWGTRSLSALATVGGLFAAGVAFSYPLCSGRLTLFAYFSLVWLCLEGLAWIARSGGPPAIARRAAAVLAAVLVAATLPAAAATARRMWFEDSPQNIRPLLALIAERPERRIVAGPCTRYPVLTLPEWIRRDDLFSVDAQIAARQSPWPAESEFWLLRTHDPLCSAWADETRRRALSFTRVSPRGSMLELDHVVMPKAADGMAQK